MQQLFGVSVIFIGVFMVSVLLVKCLKSTPTPSLEWLTILVVILSSPKFIGCFLELIKDADTVYKMSHAIRQVYPLTATTPATSLNIKTVGKLNDPAIRVLKKSLSNAIHPVGCPIAKQRQHSMTGPSQNRLFLLLRKLIIQSKRLSLLMLLRLPLINGKPLCQLSSKNDPSKKSSPLDPPNANQQNHAWSQHDPISQAEDEATITIRLPKVRLHNDGTISIEISSYVLLPLIIMLWMSVSWWKKRMYSSPTPLLPLVPPKAKTVQQLIAEGHLPLALTKFQQEIKNPDDLDENHILLLQSRLSQLLRDRSMGVITGPTFYMEYSLITKSLLELLSKYEPSTDDV